MKTDEIERNARLIYRLKGLAVACAVLHLGAHPDDEDIGLLAYLTCKHGVRSVYWSATRGEGGQNRIGPYREEALGVYRTWESLAAREVDGGECLFGPFYDFGYSKNAQETLTKWGREALIREVVRAIRLVQPHVVVARWKGEPGDFHGHHQAVGQVSLEALDAAGDPQQFPELRAQGLAAWQPLKFYHSLDNSGGDLSAGGAVNISGALNPTLERDGVVRLNTGEFDPIAGRTHQERAWVAYNRHRTQGMGLAPAPGDFFYYFSLHRSLVPTPPLETDFFEGLDPSLTGLADHPGKGSRTLRARLQEVQDLVREALSRLRADDPMEIGGLLLDGLAGLRDLSAHLPQDLEAEARQALHLYLGRKVMDFQEVLVRCLGLELESLSPRPRLIPGQSLQISARLWNQRSIPLEEASFEVSLPDNWPGPPPGPVLLKGPGHLSAAFEVTVPEGADLSCPYWLAQPRPSYLYAWPQGEPCGRPFGPPQVSVSCEVSLGRHRLTLKKGVTYREAFPGGFRELPLAFIPPISLHPKTSREFLQFKTTAQHLELQVTALNNSHEAVTGSLELVVPPGWEAAPGRMELSLAKPGDVTIIRHKVTIPAGTPAGCYPLDYQIRCGHRDYGVVLTPVRMGAPGLPGILDGSTCVQEEFIIAPSQVMVHLLEVRFVQGLSYAYVQGADEELTEALKPFGIHFHQITDLEMGHLDLGKFDAIIIGPNAYLVRGELKKYAGRFLEYVQGGGTLIVQYQGYRYQQQGATPYPFGYHQPHDRVTDEKAPVKVLDPGHALFRLPNAIEAHDFDRWVRERGLYFFGQWDKRYRPLLSCADPGEEPKEGGLLECQYGRGTFLYVGYSFFRQLPAGVDGAFRLFANILALPAARLLERMEFLKKISLFQQMSEEQLEAVARIMAERCEDDGAFLCRQGDLGHELYIIYQGEVEIIKTLEGVEKIIFVARKGDCIGELAVLGNIPRTAAMRARGDVHLLVIDGDHFRSLLRQHPDMSLQMIKLLVDKLAAFGG